MHWDPAVHLGRVFQGGNDVETVPLVHRDAVAPGDKPDDVVARQRITALSELDQTVVDPLDHHAA